MEADTKRTGTEADEDMDIHKRTDHDTNAESNTNSGECNISAWTHTTAPPKKSSVGARRGRAACEDPARTQADDRNGEGAAGTGRKQGRQRGRGRMPPACLKQCTEPSRTVQISAHGMRPSRRPEVVRTIKLCAIAPQLGFVSRQPNLWQSAEIPARARHRAGRDPQERCVRTQRSSGSVPHKRAAMSHHGRMASRMYQKSL